MYVQLKARKQDLNDIYAKSEPIEGVDYNDKVVIASLDIDAVDYVQNWYIHSLIATFDMAANFVREMFCWFTVGLYEDDGTKVFEYDVSRVPPLKATLEGLSGYGRTISDIQKYIAYDNITNYSGLQEDTSVAANPESLGSVNERWFVKSTNVQRCMNKYVQSKQSAINDFTPFDPNKQAQKDRMTMFITSFQEYFDKWGIRLCKSQVDSAVEFGFQVCEEYYNLHQWDIGVPRKIETEDGVIYEVLQGMLPPLVYEVFRICIDLIVFKSHFPIIFLDTSRHSSRNRSEYNILEEQDLLMCFNKFLHSLGVGIIFYTGGIGKKCSEQVLKIVDNY